MHVTEDRKAVKQVEDMNAINDRKFVTLAKEKRLSIRHNACNNSQSFTE